MLKLTAQVKLQPTPDQHSALLRTMQQANAACNTISAVAWAEKAFGRVPLHRLTYYDMRDAFGLSAQLVVRCIGKVVDAYKLDTHMRRAFRPDGAIPYDSRILSWKVEQRTVSIWTVEGRQTIAFAVGARALELLQAQRGESDLCLVDGVFYLFAACDVETPEPADVGEFLGVDLGIKNIASDSDGTHYSGSHLNNLRKRHAKLRQKLQAKGTKSARRLMKRRRRKEHRTQKHINHVISKRLVAKANGTARGIALEDLSGIKERVTVRKGQRRQHHAWSYHDLRQKIEYKAQLAGVVVVAVDPRNTSRTCPVCGLIDKRNRPRQDTFSCVSCGFCGHADTVAAGNIASRAAVNRPYAAGLRA